jgi:AI-2 transport protein TqsA
MTTPSIVRPLFIAVALALLLAAMHFAAPVLVPLGLAAFVAALLYPIYRGLIIKRVPAFLALLVVIALLIGAGLLLVLLIGGALRQLTASLALYADLLAQRQMEVAALVDRLSQAPGLRHLTLTLDGAALAQLLNIFPATMLAVATQSFFIFLATIFLLTEGAQFAARIELAFGHDHPLASETIALSTAIVSYFRTRTVLNLITGIGIAIVLALLGVDYAVIWGVLTFFMCYIPYLGILIALTPPVLLGFAEFGLGMGALIILFALIITGATEKGVSPILMRRSLHISPTVVFLSLVLWIWLLGPGAALIATPLTVAMLAILANFEETRRWAALAVGIPVPPDDQPAPES